MFRWGSEEDGWEGGGCCGQRTGGLCVFQPITCNCAPASRRTSAGGWRWRRCGGREGWPGLATSGPGYTATILTGRLGGILE